MEFRNNPATPDKDSIKRFYDWLGTRLDTQTFYEQAGFDELVRHGRFESAHAVFEFGCGTGRFALQLLKKYLSTDCYNTAIDISSTMVMITRERLTHWEDRTNIMVSTGSVGLDFDDGSFDRFVCTYVIDILSEEDSFRLIEEAYRVLLPGGLLCLAGITHGTTWFSKMVMGIWRFMHKLNPILTGGCRPVRLPGFITPEKWTIEHHQVLSRYGVAVEAVVAHRL